MAATIKIKNSSTASAVPTSSDLVQGELAVNVTDKRVFTENASGTVVELGTNPSILTLPDGSASAPTLTNDGDTNTGIFFPAADTVGITTGGTERARVDSSGNLGVGTSSPAQRLHLAQAGQPKIEFEDTTNTSKGRITTGGSTGSMTFDADPDNAKAGTVMTFNVDATERARIDSSGNLLVGTTSTSLENSRSFAWIGSSGGLFRVNHSTSNGSGDGYIEFGYNGTKIGSITQNGTTGVLFNITSDYRLKTVTGAVSGHGERIDALEPVEYTWNSDGSVARGFLAHKFQEVYPSSVSGEKDAVDEDGNPKYQNMQASTSEVIADLVAEIKSLRIRIAALEA